MTMARLLAVPQGERWAEQLKREFRVSEKRYAHFRLLGSAIQNDCWREIEKMSKMSKPPVHVEVSRPTEVFVQRLCRLLIRVFIPVIYTVS